MNRCDECGESVDNKDLGYNPKWKNWICRKCFVGELIGNAENNKAQSAILGSNRMAYAAAYKAANILFDKALRKYEVGKDG